jgi:hypothetical protein
MEQSYRLKGSDIIITPFGGALEERDQAFSLPTVMLWRRLVVSNTW